MPADPAEFDPESALVVTLAGKQWPIPPLVWRDLKKCRAELLELTDTINRAVAAAAAIPDEDADARMLRDMGVVSQVFQELSNDDFDRLVMGPIHAGLAAANPSLTRAEFESWPISEIDRQLAWLVVRTQSGLFLVREDGPDSQPGEIRGAPRSPTQTGKASS